MTGQWLRNGAAFGSPFSIETDNSGFANVMLQLTDASAYYLNGAWELRVTTAADGVTYVDRSRVSNLTVQSPGNDSDSSSSYEPRTAAAPQAVSSTGQERSNNLTPITTAEVQTAMAQARAEGSNVIRTQSRWSDGPKYITPQVLALMDGFEYVHDTVGSPVQVRVRITEPARIRRTINLSASLNSFAANMTTQHFEQHFPGSNVRVVDFDQTEPWEQNVRKAARVDFAGVNTQNLHFYSYNRSTNRYTPIQTGYQFDANGYIHFSSELAGSIVIADRSLTGRSEYFANPGTGGLGAVDPVNLPQVSYGVHVDNGSTPEILFHPNTGGGMFGMTGAFPSAKPILDMLGMDRSMSEAERVGLIIFVGFIALAAILPMIEMSTRKRKQRPQPALAGYQAKPIPPSIPQTRTVPRPLARPSTMVLRMPPSRDVANVLEQALINRKVK
jgi:hypothetical protein